MYLLSQAHPAEPTLEGQSWELKRKGNGNIIKIYISFYVASYIWK